MITVSWQQGALKGYTPQETSQMIIEAMQWWQSLCGVRFGTLPFGYRTQITIYPYSGNMNGAFMGTYVQTGQIIYTTNVKTDRDFCVTAFAHEIGHTFGLDHVNRPSALMWWRGSEDRYFDTQEARAAWATFGKYTGWHWPYSLRFYGNQIRHWKSVYEKAKADHKKYQDLREAEKNVAKRKAYDKTCREHLAVRRSSHKELASVNKRWLELKRAWDSIGGIRVPNQKNIEAIQMDDSKPFDKNQTGICECFDHLTPKNMIMEKVDMRKVYESLPLGTK